MATTTKALLTAEEFMERYDGERWYELVRGEVVQLSPPNFEHGYICLNIGSILRDYAKRSGLGAAVGNDAAVRTTRDPDTLRGADVAYYTYDRFPRTERKAVIPKVAPDLAVEVNSPSNRPGETRQKVTEYLNAGVLMVWVVDPESRTVSIERPNGAEPIVLNETDILENLPELPGFRCLVSEFFE
jgi:Uma2 family endonuclease